MEEAQFSERIKMLLSRRKWQIQELKLKRTKSQTADKDEQGNAVLVDQSVSRKRVVRKCEFPEREEADNAVKFLTSDACLDYLRLCGAELNSAVGEDADAKIEWVPIQAWYSEEDATNQHARKGMLYHVLKIRGDDGKGEGPYETQDGCKYKEEYTFFWDVDAPPEVPKGRSGVQYELDVKRREDEDGLGGLYDCVLVKRVTVEQDVGAYESHKELSETRTTAQMLGVSDESDIVDDNDERPKDKYGNFIHKSVDEKIEAYAKTQNMVTEDGGGIVVDITKEKNADCTTSVTIHNTKEEEAPKSTVSAEVTVRSIKTVTVNENVAAEGDEEYELNPDGTPKLDDDKNPIKSKYPQVSVGDDGTVTKKTVTKTKGGLRTVQIETTTPIALAEGDTTRICERTLFEHVDVKVKEAQTAAEADQTAAPSGGIYKKIQSTLRDDGLWDVQTTETEELEVLDAVVHKSKTGTQFVEDVTKKNSDDTETSVVLGTGEGVSDNKITEVQVTQTPGGRKDIRTITRTPIAKDETFVFATDSTRRSTRTLHLRVFENLTHAEISTSKNDKGESVISNYTDGNIRINEFGLYDGQMQYYETSEKPTGDNDGPEYGEDAWQTKLMTKTSITQFADNVWTCTEKWIEIVGYKKADLDDIYNKFVGKDMIAINPSPANRDRTEWSVRAETAHWFTYESIINSAKHSNGTPYAESDFDW